MNHEPSRMMRHANLPDAGRRSHREIDAQIPTPEEKRALAKIAPEIADFSEDSLRLQVSTANVSNPPTDAELDAAFANALAQGPAGFVALLDDDGAGANVYLVGSDGSNWWYVALTKAV